MSGLNISRSLLPVKTGRKMLSEIVGVIVLAFIPVNSNLLVNFFIAKPMHVHVPCFGLFLVSC